MNGRKNKIDIFAQFRYKYVLDLFIFLLCDAIGINRMLSLTSFTIPPFADIIMEFQLIDIKRSRKKFRRVSPKF